VGVSLSPSLGELILIDSVPYPTQSGQVGGHEGVGIVHKLGPGSENGRVKVGDRVGIKVRTRRRESGGNGS
jgi:D-arabinose 1-dehydrogenase-like Zn-dependent alcohol dehydrogenase